MRIVEADLAALKSAARRGRVRSPETQQLVEAVESLEPGKAKAVVVEGGETAAMVRARLMYVAKAVGVKLDVAVKEDRVLFALKNGRRRSKPH